MRMMVTGGAGFVGSHLCDALLAQGHTVIAVDNFLTGRAANIAHLGNERRFELKEHDICVPFDFGRVDYVLNFASPASPRDYAAYGIETLKVGSYGTINALEVARKYSAKFLMASTSECYGDALEHPQHESYWGNVNPVGPRSAYDEAKRFSEAATVAYRRYHATDAKIARIFNTYGPRLQLNDGRVISNFMQQALRGEDLTVYGEGSQTRSFCYVDEEVEGLIRLAFSEEAGPMNLGNPKEFTILECAEMVLKVTASKSKIKFEPLPQDDPRQRQPDITLAKTKLGWEPKVGLEEGLRLSLPYFQEVVQQHQVSGGTT